MAEQQVNKTSKQDDLTTFEKNVEKLKAIE